VNAPAPPASITALELAFVVGPHTGQQVANLGHKESVMQEVPEDRKFKLAAITLEVAATSNGQWNETDSEREKERREGDLFMRQKIHAQVCHGVDMCRERKQRKELAPARLQQRI
jgi:hypothetical protein